MPIIIIGGILSGIFTATESGAIACAYAIIIGGFVYRELKPSKMFDLFVDCAKSTGQVLIVVSCASLFTWVITVAQFRRPSAPCCPARSATNMYC